MKPVSVLLALLTLGVALSAVAWVTKPNPQAKTAKEAFKESLLSQADQEAAEQIETAVNEPVAENPFDLTGTGPHPKAVIDDSMHDFVSMEAGKEERHTFVIRNEGEAPLKLKGGPVQCKCTVAKLNLNEVLPGESAEIEMSWKPTAVEEEFHQKADIWTNDPENSKVELHVKGAVVELVTISPRGDWALNRIEGGETRKITGFIFSQHLDGFNILGHETSTELVTAEFEPMSDEELEKERAKCGYQIHVTVKGEMAVGKFRATLTMMTDIDGGQDFDIHLWGLRPGPFSILGESWFAKNMLVRIGEVERSQGKTVKLSMFVTPGEEPIEFETVSTDPPFLDLTFEKDESFDVPAREKYWMIFTVPPDSPVGVWTGERTGTIVVNTNSDAMPQIELNAELIVNE